MKTPAAAGSTTPAGAFETFLAGTLKGGRMPWPDLEAGAGWPAIVNAARAHGVQALLAEAVLRQADGGGWPAAARTALADEARAHAVTESRRSVDVAAALDALLAAGVEVLVLKGTQLAYTHYASPWLRPCADVDLLVEPRARRAADAVLLDLGYRRFNQATGDLVTGQLHYTRDPGSRFASDLDLHWRTADPQAFAALLSFEELARDAVTIPALGAAARGPSAVHALLLACLHRVAHHWNSRRLIWIYDIHLLAGGLDEDEWRTFVAHARDKRIRAVCASGLEVATDVLGTAVPAFVTRGLVASQPEDTEPTAAFLRPGRRRVDVLLSDLRHLGWRDRLRLLRQHLLPPPAYMHRATGRTSALLLPMLYGRRIVRGASEWFRRSG